MLAPARTQRVARAAARRLLWVSMVRHSGVALTVATTVLLVVYAAERAFGPGLDRGTLWLIGSVWLLASVLLASAMAWRGRRDLLGGAMAVDRTLGLKDKLSSALQLHASAPGDVFAAIAVEDAERAAEGVPVSRVAPIRPGNWWSAFPVAAAAALGVSYLPPMRLVADTTAEKTAALESAERARAAVEIERASEALRELTSRGASTVDLAPPESDKLLDKLREQLASDRPGGVKPQEAMARAAEAIATASEAASRRADAMDAAEQQSRAILSELSPGVQADDPGGVEKLRDALARADAEAAASQAAELLERQASLSQEERDDQGERLRRLADQLRELAEAAERDMNTTESADRGGSGETPETGPSADEGGREPPAPEPDQPSPGAAPTTPPTDLAPEHDAKREGIKNVRELADMIRRAAEQVKQPRPDPRPPESGSPGQGQGAAPRTTPDDAGQDKRDGSGVRPDHQPSNPGNEQGSRPDQPGDKQATQAIRDSSRSPDQNSTREGTRAAQDKQGDRPNAPAREHPGAAEPTNTQQQVGEPRQQGHSQVPEKDESRRQAQGREQQQPGDKGTPRSGHTPGEGDQPTQGDPGSALQQLRDRLQNMSNSHGEAERRRAAARRLQEQSSRMVDAMGSGRDSPDHGTRAASPPIDPQRAGARSVPLDLRNPDQGGDSTPPRSDVLAEFDNPGAQADTRADRGTRPMTPTAVEALRSAQKAIEEKRLPARYRNVERYFRREAEREVRRPDVAPAKDAGDIRDAKDSG